MPDAERVGVSRKIGDREARKRLRAQVEEVLPKDAGGVIVRTVGEDVTKEILEHELSTLIGQWKKIKRKTHFVRAPNLIHRETSLTRGLIRDVFSTKVEQVTVDSKQVYNEILEYLKGIAPELIDRIKLYEEELPLFDKQNIEPEIRDLFKRRCDLPSGGYLIIEQTEALVSVDVNSGRYTGKKDPEKTILRRRTLEAAREDRASRRVCAIWAALSSATSSTWRQRRAARRWCGSLRTHLGRDRARTKAYRRRASLASSR